MTRAIRSAVEISPLKHACLKSAVAILQTHLVRSFQIPDPLMTQIGILQWTDELMNESRKYGVTRTILL
jgi:hypothetical protein